MSEYQANNAMQQRAANQWAVGRHFNSVPVVRLRKPWWLKLWQWF